MHLFHIRDNSEVPNYTCQRSQAVPLITTERLILRAWKNEDVEPYAEMNADPRVREFFPSVLTREQSEAEVRRVQAACDAGGFWMLAAELIETGKFVGVIGLQTMPFVVPSVAQPAVEIGWRLSHEYWGKGLAATERRPQGQFNMCLRLSDSMKLWPSPFPPMFGHAA